MILYTDAMSTEVIRKELYDRLAFTGRVIGNQPIPHTLHEGLVEYVLVGRPVGHFLTAMLEGDLYQACARADERSRHAMYSIVFWLVNYTPNSCFGSPERVREWIERKGFRGQEATDGRS